VETVSARGQTHIEEPSAAERTIARRTAEARATIPDLELSVEADVTRRFELFDVSLTALLVAACAGALRAVPRANGAYRDGRFELYSRVNVGVVLASEEAYVIPTVFDADTKSPRELTGEIAELELAARERRLAPPAFSGGTFTLWDAGTLGLSRAGIVINPPQVAALAAGVPREVATLNGSALQTIRQMTLTLACDHRMLYGAHAASFLGAVKAALESG